MNPEEQTETVERIASISTGISVIIPSFNPGAYLRAAVSSVIDQASDVPIEEILIVDDGSNDQTTRAVYEELESAPFVRLLRNDRRKGAGGARNAGISAARGEWIAFLDADDLWFENGLSALLTAADSFPDCGWIGGDFIMLDAAGEPKEKDSFFRSRPMTRQLLTRAFSTGQPQRFPRPVEAFLTTALTNTISGIIRRDLAVVTGGFNEQLAGQEDYNFFLRLAARSDFVFVPTVMGGYRIHSNNSTRFLANELRWRVQAVQDLLNEPALRQHQDALKEKATKVLLQRAYTLSQQGNHAGAIGDAIRAIVQRPATPAAYGCLMRLIAAWTIRRRAVAQ